MASTILTRVLTLTVFFDGSIPKVFRLQNIEGLSYGVTETGGLMVYGNHDPSREVAMFAPGKWIYYEVEREEFEIEEPDVPEAVEEPEFHEVRTMQGDTYRIPFTHHQDKLNQEVPVHVLEPVTVELPKVEETTEEREARQNQEAYEVLKARLEQQNNETVFLDPDSTGDPDLDSLLTKTMVVSPGAVSYRIQTGPGVAGVKTRRDQVQDPEETGFFDRVLKEGPPIPEKPRYQPQNMQRGRAAGRQPKPKRRGRFSLSHR